MKFDEMWKHIEGLPSEAKVQVPQALSKETKDKLGKKTPDEVTQILLYAIDEVNHGSVETIDNLVKKKLGRG